jgi:quercetin dioxygenase-like cupin family protein
MRIRARIPRIIRTLLANGLTLAIVALAPGLHAQQGGAPARFEVNVSNAKTLHPADVQPAPAPGVHWVQAVSNRRPAAYDTNNQAHSNLFEVVKERRFTQNVVRDPRSEVLFIYGLEKELPPLEPKDRGHFHPESAEFWVVMTGQIRFAIEGQPVFVADEGDVVYVPPSTYHLARFHGDAPELIRTLRSSGIEAPRRHDRRRSPARPPGRRSCGRPCGFGRSRGR